MVLETESKVGQDNELVNSGFTPADASPLELIGFEEIAPTCTIDSYLEMVAQWAESKFGSEELVQARDEFAWKFGKVFHDDRFFHQRMIYFLDYFIFQRPLSVRSNGAVPETPFESYLHRTIDAKQGASALSTPMSGYCHSIFEVKKVQKFEIVVKDLFSDEAIVILPREGQHFGGILKKELFQGFLYRMDDETCRLSHGAIFHPSEVWRLIRKAVKRAKKQQDADLDRELAKFARLNLRFLRHEHVSPKKIYAQELI